MSTNRIAGIVGKLESGGFGVPEKLVAAVKAHQDLDRQARQRVNDPELPKVKRQLAQEVADAAFAGTEPKSLQTRIEKAAAADAAAEHHHEILRQAVAFAEQKVRGEAHRCVDEIMTSLRQKVHKALEIISEAAGKVPAGMDDATAFRAPSEVQAAWRKLTEAAEVVKAALMIRRDMCNRHGSVLDHPVPGCAGLESLVPNARDLKDAGKWPGPFKDGEDLTVATAHALLQVHRAGGTFRMMDSSELEAQQAEDERKRATHPDQGAKRPRTVSFA